MCIKQERTTKLSLNDHHQKLIAIRGESSRLLKNTDWRKVQSGRPEDSLQITIRSVAWKKLFKSLVTNPSKGTFLSAARSRFCCLLSNTLEKCDERRSDEILFEKCFTSFTRFGFVDDFHKVCLIISKELSALFTPTFLVTMKK